MSIFKMLPTKRMINSIYKKRLAMDIIVVCVLLILFVADVYFTFKTS